MRSALYVGLAVLPSVVLGGLVVYFGKGASSENISIALTNASTVGGIVSGLSLAATSILTISGSYREHVLKNYGTTVRFLLFGGFALVVSFSLIASVSMLWEGEPWLIWVLGITLSVTLLIMLMTALLYSAAFDWQQFDDNSDSAKKPPDFNFLS